MTEHPTLDKIAADEMLDDSSLIQRAIEELDEMHNATLHSSRGLNISLRCTVKGWVILYEEGYGHPTSLNAPHGRGFLTAEDAIQALREKVDGWIVQAEGEDAEPCTEAARKAGCTCTVPFAHSASIDPPEPRIDRDCPLHGRRDPDTEHHRRQS